MSLQASRNRFQKQPEMCQATLTRIAAKAGPSRNVTNHSATPQPLINIKPPAPAIKFSDDIKRLQYINSIRGASDGAQLKRVIDLLLETRQALTPEQINEACYVDINLNKAVFDSLRNNLKVRYDGTYFAYKPKHDVKDKNQLLDLIHKYQEGISVFDLDDAYPNVVEDIKALKAEGLIWLLSFNSQEYIAYPNKTPAPLKVDDDLKLLFRAMELPQEMIDIEKYLQKNGMKPATNTAKRREKMAEDHVVPSEPKLPKKKKGGISKRTKLTNAYLPELFKELSGS